MCRKESQTMRESPQMPSASAAKPVVDGFINGLKKPTNSSAVATIRKWLSDSMDYAGSSRWRKLFKRRPRAIGVVVIGEALVITTPKKAKKADDWSIIFSLSGVGPAERVLRMIRPVI